MKLLSLQYAIASVVLGYSYLFLRKTKFKYSMEIGSIASALWFASIITFFLTSCSSSKIIVKNCVHKNAQYWECEK